VRNHLLAQHAIRTLPGREFSLPANTPPPIVRREAYINFRDLLKRHAAGHNTDGKDTRKHHSSPHLTRVAQACTACATAKLRCGNDKPCRRCLNKGIPCTFPPPNEKQRHSSQKAEFIPSEFQWKLPAVNYFRYSQSSSFFYLRSPFHISLHSGITLT